MSIQLDISSIQIPFKQKFKHASRSRGETESILVKATDGNHSGYGEGCPRDYVTGESVETCKNQFQSISEQVSSLDNFESLLRFRAENRQFIKKNPSLWCAMEMALLDLFARQKNLPLHEFLSIGFRSQSQFTAVLGISSRTKFIKNVLKYRLNGMKDFKVKISGNRSQDLFAIWILRFLGSKTIRVDANNFWHKIDQANDYIKKLHTDFLGVEEPIKLGTNSLGDLIHNSSFPVILDEHFTHIDQMNKIDRTDKAIINLRVSKVGGILNAMEVIRQAKEKKIQLILGSHVGETSLLARAAHLVSCYSPASFLHFEGAYSDYLLSNDPGSPKIKFGPGGKVDFDKFKEKPGLGIKFSKEDSFARKI